MKKYLQVFIVLLFTFGFSQDPWQILPFTPTGGDCDDITTAGEIFISEVYDGLPGGGGEASYAVIELYNPTNTAISLSNYRMRRAGDYDAQNWDGNFGGAWGGSAGTNLPGSIAANSTYLIRIESGNGSSTCSFTPNHILSSGHGINEDDRVQLLKNGTPLDEVRTPNYVGFTIIRRPNAEVPKPLFNNADWQTVGRSCAGLGSHTIDNTTPPEIDNISRYRDNPGTPPYTFCATPTRIRVQMDSMGGTYTYSYNLQGTTTGINLTGTTGIFSNLFEDVYNLTVTVRKNGVILCTIITQFTITGGTETSPIILLNP